MSIFTIDYFELAFLAEACIPPRPIARSVFWDSLINKHYNSMSNHERNHLFVWLKKSIDGRRNEEIDLFYARFDPQNQFKVFCDYKGKQEVKDCFYYKNHYHTDKNTSIVEEYITKIEQNTERINIQ
jgi:HSP90 family molecular chaperone